MGICRSLLIQVPAVFCSGAGMQAATESHNVQQILYFCELLYKATLATWKSGEHKMSPSILSHIDSSYHSMSVIDQLHRSINEKYFAVLR